MKINKAWKELKNQDKVMLTRIFYAVLCFVVCIIIFMLKG
jgi:hypothetical protein